MKETFEINPFSNETTNPLDALRDLALYHFPQLASLSREDIILCLRSFADDHNAVLDEELRLALLLVLRDGQESYIPPIES